jgi:hypothetical protein
VATMSLNSKRLASFASWGLVNTNAFIRCDDCV